MDLTGMLQAAAGVSTGNPNAWDISYAVYDAGPDAGDVSKSFYSGLSYGPLSTQDTSPQGIFFKPDGLTVYMVGSTNDTVYQYTMPVAWSMSGVTYASKSFSVISQDNDPQGLSFKPDGTKMYVIGRQNDTIYQYSLSTAWDVSTASYDSVSFSVATEETLPVGVRFKPDGTKMYVVGVEVDEINEYDLSSAWDISTASYVQNFSVNAQEANPTGVSFISDGTKMYVSGNSGDDINQYDLSTPWDISTASFVTSFSVSSQTLTPQDIFVKPDGSMFFVLALSDSGGGTTNTQRIFQYPIGSFSVAAQEANPADVFFKDDGTKMYITGNIGDDVNEYDLSTAWDITTASYLQVFSVAAQDTNPTSLFFKPDGLKMYVLGVDGQDVNEYALSTPWDVSSSSYTTNFSTASQAPQPRGCWFKPDGTKMYVSCATNDAVYQYSLSTAWDVSSASYDSVSFSVAAQETVPQALTFKPDGLKMYVLGSTGDDINEYDLSSAWDISSASYVQNLPVLETAPTGLYWRDNGEEFFIVGTTGDRVLKYSISST